MAESYSTLRDKSKKQAWKICKAFYRKQVSNHLYAGNFMKESVGLHNHTLWKV